MHPEEEQLLRLADSELPAQAATQLITHMAGCSECQSRFRSIQQANELYREYQDALKRSDPAPPRPWEDLTRRLPVALHHADDFPLPVRRLPYGVWLAAAAAVLVGVVVLLRVARTPRVSAAELLQKASAAQASPDTARRIRIRAAGQSFVRPAVLHATRTANPQPGLAALFTAARYDWEDPFSARSFAGWRSQLSDKEDQVRTLPGPLYEIRVTTSSGSLTEAVLALSAKDLRPVRESLRFRGETVEITEAEPAVVTAQQDPARVAPGVQPGLDRSLGASEELQVMAALHRIGADLGEPVDVNLDGGTVRVRGTGLSPQREEQVRAAVAVVPGVAVEFERPTAEALQAGDGRKVAGVLGGQSELASRLGEEGINRVLDTSEAVMGRAYALQSLSRRFPPGAEAQLADAERGVLATLRSEHVSALAARLHELESALAPVLTEPPHTEAHTADWHTATSRLLTAAQRLDQLLNAMLAGSGDFSARVPDLAAALRSLDAEVLSYPEGRQ
jgi:hypothetical protein